MRGGWRCALPLLGLAALLWAAPAAAQGPGLSGLEMAVTYAHGALQVYEIGAAAGQEVVLPVAAGARDIRVTGGAYRLTAAGGAGRSALVKSAKGQASVRYRIPTPTDRDELFVWRTRVPIGHVVMLTGPSVHPSGLGMAPFRLGGGVTVSGEPLVSFTAAGLPAGYTERWLLELGQPGAWIANLMAGLGIALPLLFIGIALRPKRKEAA